MSKLNEYVLRFFNSLPASNAKLLKYGCDPPCQTSETTDDSSSEPNWRSFRSPRATTMYDTLQQGYRAASLPGKSSNPFDSKGADFGAGTASGSALTEQMTSDHVSAMELGMMASYKKTKMANDAEVGRSSGSKDSSWKQTEEGSSWTPIRAGWLDVPRGLAVDSCLVPSRSLESFSNLELRLREPSPPEGVGLVGNNQQGEKSKGVVKEEYEIEEQQRPIHNSSKGNRKPAMPHPDPFWNEQVDWSIVLAHKYTLPQTDPEEVFTSR